MDVRRLRGICLRGGGPRVRQEGEIGALEFGARKGEWEVVRLLLYHSASESIRESAADQKVLGEESKKALVVTPLALAGGADSGNVEMAKFLLGRGGYPLSDDNGVWRRLTPHH